MSVMFEAMDHNYNMAMQLKYTLNTLQKFGQLNDKHIWRNLTYFIDWMEKNLPNDKFVGYLGKSYIIDDCILYRIEKTEDGKKSDTDEGLKEPKTFETWLMSDIFRYVENPEIEKNPLSKYIGKVKFTKIIAGKYQNESDRKWTPPKSKENGEYEQEPLQVDDIEIVVYYDNEMNRERKYEYEYGWKEEWVTESICNSPAPDNQNVERSKMYEEFKRFERGWNERKKQIKVPGWYHFDPKYPECRPPGHNRIKKWNPSMFNFLKNQKWIDRKGEEKSSFVVDCGQLLGIGGEAIVIRKSVADKVQPRAEPVENKQYEALKIIPIEKNNFKDRKKFPNADIRHQDVEIFESHETKFRHGSLMEYSNMYLDFIKIFGERILVMVIGKFDFII